MLKLYFVYYLELIIKQTPSLVEFFSTGITITMGSEILHTVHLYSVHSKLCFVFLLIEI
jgi:hypothetical protein